MENLKHSSNLKYEVDNQLKAALIEIKQLQKENQLLSSTCSQLKEKLGYSLKAQDSIVEVEQNYKKLLQDYKALQNELQLYQGCVQLKDDTASSGKPTYQQVETELEDIQKMFKQFYSLQEKQILTKTSLINQLPIQILRECWQAIIQTFRSQFNTFQLIQSSQDELAQLEQEYRISIHTQAKDLTHVQEIARQQKIHDLRVDIERIRKEIQMQQADSKKMEVELSELGNEFAYICRIEGRRFNLQLEQEKQLISMKQKTEGREHYDQLRARQSSDHYNLSMRNDSQSSFKKPLILRVAKANIDYPRISSECEKSQLEKTIENTRKKLSRQLSMASNFSKR